MQEPTYNPHERHLIALLNRAADLMVQEMNHRLGEAGLDDIREAHGCVFGNIGPEGARLTELAERAGLTKQAVGEVVSELERLGYVERSPDPVDGRAKIIRLTDQGAVAQRAGYAILDEIEAEWAERIGEDGLEQLRDRLAELLGMGVPAGA